MNNLFDSANYPDAVPAELTAGARWVWTRSDITAAYPTADYTLKFRFCFLASPYTESTITAGKVDSAHVVEESQSATGSYLVGDHTWQAVIVRDSDDEEIIVDRGFFKVLPNLGDSPAEASSWVYQVLAAIRATILGTASKEQASYSIGGRSLSLRTISELMELEQEFSKRWKAEIAENNRAAGRSCASNTIRVKF
jgi:hypothetical protein